MIGSSIDLARCLFETSRDGILQTVPETGRIVDANPAAEQLTGLSREQLLELQRDELLHQLGSGTTSGTERARLGRCNQPDLLVTVTRQEISGDTELLELIIFRESRSFQPTDYSRWIDPVVVTDSARRIRWCNSAFHQLTGLESEGVIGLALDDLFDSGSRSWISERLQQVHTSEIEVATNPQLSHASGGPIHTEMWSRPIEFDGEPAALSVLRDLTDQKRVEAFHAGQMKIMESLALGDDLMAVLESLIELIERLFVGTRASVLLLDRDGVTLRHGAAPSLPDEYNAVIDGLECGPCVGSCGTAVHGKERVAVFDTLTDPLWEDYRELAIQFEHRACWSQPVLTPDGDVLGTFALYHRQPRGPTSLEIELIENAAHVAGIAIQRSRSDEALRESQNEIARQRRELELILDAVQAQVVYMDSEARVVRHNRYSRELLGLSDDDIRGLNVKVQAPHLDDPELRHEQSLEVIRTGQPRLGSIESFEEDSGRRWVSIDKVPTRDDDGNVNGLLLFIYDITQLKQAEVLARESQELFRQLADNIDSAFWMADEIERRLIYVSPPYERIFGRPCQEIYEKPDLFLESVVPEDRNRVRLKIDRQLAGEATIEEYRIKHPDGSVHWIRDQAFPIRDESGQVVRVAGITEDITEMRMTESRLREHEARLGRVAKLSTLGEMAAGIVHELTQPLAALRNYASVSFELAQRETETLDINRLRTSTERIVEQTHRAGDIVGRVRKLVTQSAPQRESHDVNELIRNTLNVVETDLRNASVQIETLLSSAPVTVRVDPVQIEQLLINLVRNAVDALHGNPSDDRRLSISSTQSNGECRIAVEDNGPGFNGVEPESVFDLFFTTRSHGMGVGLSISRTIARVHDGQLTAGSPSGGGAIFELALPAISPSAPLI